MSSSPVSLVQSSMVCLLVLCLSCSPKWCGFYSYVFGAVLNGVSSSSVSLVQLIMMCHLLVSVVEPEPEP